MIHQKRKFIEIHSRDKVLEHGKKESLTRFLTNSLVRTRFCVWPLLPCIFNILEIIDDPHPDLNKINSSYTNGWNSKTKKKVTSLLKTVIDLYFIVGVITLYVLCTHRQVSLKSFRGRLKYRLLIDIVRANQELNDV